ncbi:hypothetical protein BU17DRAFT_37943 [Hysterangium stoloniferum]|nr:hypothetical protein BU17DRAFT_37943 [Hysterangium stoloniferum]
MPPKVKKPSKENGEPTGANGKGKGTVPSKAAPAAPAAPVTAAPVQDSADAKAVTGTGKPDQAEYHAEQEKVRAEIDAVQAKITAVKEKIGLTSKNGPGNDRRIALRAELDTLRAKQSSGKTSRSKLLEQLNAIQEGIQKKVKDLQAAKAKAPFKSVAEVDAQIKQLEKQVGSGNLKLGDEKRALSEISSLKRSRKTVEGFQADQDAITADRTQADELRSQLDDPESKAISQRYDAIRGELDELKKESDEAFSGRNKLFDERNALSAELDALYAKKRESAQRFREASDKYWQKVNEERTRRAEKLKAQRAAEEEEKRKEVAERLLEEAKAPAFQAKIEDCQTLIDYFTAKVSGGSAPIPAPTTLSTSSKSDVAGVPKLELRQVEQPGEGLVARKKKGEDQESYFVGGKGKAKRGNKNITPAPASASGALNIPFATLTALLELSIPPPASNAELPRAIEDLKTKKAWFEANQDKVTAANVAKAEAQVKRLGARGELPNGNGEHLAEPPSGAAAEETLETAEDGPEPVVTEGAVEE